MPLDPRFDEPTGRARVVVIGSGPAGVWFLENVRSDPRVEIVGVATAGRDREGATRIESLGLCVHPDFRTLLGEAEADLILDASDDPGISRQILALRPSGAEVLGGRALRFVHEILEARGTALNLAMRELEGHSETDFIVGSNPKMRELWALVAKVAPTPTTVLVRGESGTGKELVARAIHRRSALRERPLVTVNCTALSPALLESELFGHRRGSFTGADRNKIGLFEQADGGTMFLDEIGDMSLETQARVLRTLQTGEIRAVGDVNTRTVSVRIIAATNRDLEEAIGAGRFREDLFYRINTFSLTLPPLRERIEDVPVLAEHFLQRACAKVNKRVAALSPEALALLQNYAWPGNLRELENVIERAVVLTSSGFLEAEHLPLHVQSEVPSAGFIAERARAIERSERQLLARYLAEAAGNVSRAAERASLPRRTFHRLLARHGLASREVRERELGRP